MIKNYFWLCKLWHCLRIGYIDPIFYFQGDWYWAGLHWSSPAYLNEVESDIVAFIEVFVHINLSTSRRNLFGLHYTCKECNSIWTTSYNINMWTSRNKAYAFQIVCLSSSFSKNSLKPFVTASIFLHSVYDVTALKNLPWATSGLCVAFKQNFLFFNYMYIDDNSNLNFLNCIRYFVLVNVCSTFQEM